MCSFWHLLDLLHQQLVLVIHLLLQVYLTNLLIVDRLTLSGCTKPSGASHHITSLQTLTSDNRRMITTSLSFATHVFLLLLVLVVGWPIITVVIQLATPVRPKMMAVLLWENICLSAMTFETPFRLDKLRGLWNRIPEGLSNNDDLHTF